MYSDNVWVQRKIAGIWKGVAIIIHVPRRPARSVPFSRDNTT